MAEPKGIYRMRTLLLDFYKIRSEIRFILVTGFLLSTFFFNMGPEFYVIVLFLDLFFMHLLDMAIYRKIKASI